METVHPHSWEAQLRCESCHSTLTINEDDVISEGAFDHASTHVDYNIRCSRCNHVNMLERSAGAGTSDEEIIQSTAVPPHVKEKAQEKERKQLKKS